MPPGIQPKKPKPDPMFGMAMGASRGMRGGTVGEAVNRGFREGIPTPPVGKPRSDRDKKPLPLDKADKIKMAKAAAARLRGSK